jgi:hypothetical protein
MKEKKRAATNEKFFVSIIISRQNEEKKIGEEGVEKR